MTDGSTVVSELDERLLMATVDAKSTEMENYRLVVSSDKLASFELETSSTIIIIFTREINAGIWWLSEADF